MRAATVVVCLFALSGCGGSDREAPASADDTAGATNTDTLVMPAWVSVKLLGGATTNQVGNQSSTGFDTPASNLDAAALDQHLLGDGEFERNFIRAPSVDFESSDGVGPAFNSAACIHCHIRDGQGSLPIDVLNGATSEWRKLGADAGLFLRIGLARAGGGVDAGCVPSEVNRYCAPTGVPGFGTQLFHRGVIGLRADSPFTGQADVYLRFESSTVRYPDGESVSLQRPRFQIRSPWDSPGEVAGDRPAPASRVLQTDVVSSPRNGMPMFGLGLLEAIPEADILALADPDDANGDGISGRPNRVFDPVKAARGEADPVSLGRFGWKAATPSVAVQGSGAYRDDMGVTNYLFPEESIAGTPLHETYRTTNPQDDGQVALGHEVSEAIVKAVMFYSNTLAVPARRTVDDPQAMRGAALFERANCTGCHHAGFRTGSHPGIWGPSGVDPVVAVAGQQIHPFTDMLLHDMGDDLADGRDEFGASGREWKTRPLWGIGLTQTVNPLARYLHDGRARTLEEAILWHGGEADAARRAFMGFERVDRAALLRFLESL